MHFIPLIHSNWKLLKTSSRNVMVQYVWLPAHSKVIAHFRAIKSTQLNDIIACELIDIHRGSFVFVSDITRIPTKYSVNKCIASMNQRSIEIELLYETYCWQNRYIKFNSVGYAYRIRFNRFRTECPIVHHCFRFEKRFSSEMPLNEPAHKAQSS